MADSDWNPDTAGRSLAEILREAGIERATRANRRRSWDDPDETAIRQRRAEAAADRSNRSGYGRRASDLADMMDADRRGDRRAADRRGAEKPAVDRIAAPAAAQPAEERRRNRRAVPEPSTAAIPGLRPDRKPGVPHPSGPIPSAPVPPLREDRDDDLLGDDRRSERRRPDRRSDQRKAGDRRTGEGRIGSRRSGDRTAEQAAPARERGARKAGKSAADDHPSTGPIPVVRPEDVDQDLDATPKESALAWLRFAGELIIALAAGVGVYFAATLLWEQLPHLAVFLAPLAVAGLVAGVSMWRQRQGREPVGIPVLALLVFAGTLLTIAPAAGLLAAAGT